MNNAYDGFINRLTWPRTKERISKLKDMSIETPKTKMQRETMNEKIEKNLRTVGKFLLKSVTYT